MTHPLLRRAAPLVLGLALFVGLLVPAGPVLAEEDPWVAKVDDKTLYLSRLAETVAWRMRGSLREAGSGPTTILRQLVEESAIAQEARALGIQVTVGEVEAKKQALNNQVRQVSGGAKNLVKALQEQGITMEEFTHQLYIQILKEKVAAHPKHLGASIPKDERTRLAQIEVVVTEILKRTDVAYGWPVAERLQLEPAKLAAGVVATVKVYPTPVFTPGEAGEPILVRQFGDALLRSLPSKDIRRILQQECKAALTAATALSVEEMDEVIETEKANWNRWREMATQEAYRHLSYEEYVKMRYKVDLKEMREDRYFRGVFGLIRQERAKITPEQLRKEWQDHRDTRYGDAIQVTDIEILFAPQNQLLGKPNLRGRKDALRLANDILRRHSAGVPFEQMVREINQRRVNGRPDGTFHARKLTVRNTSTGRLLFERAKEMEDGQIGRPFETLSEVHVMRREKFVPAPAFEDVQDLILQGMAQRNAHMWLEEQMGNRERVEIRWPLPKE